MAENDIKAVREALLDMLEGGRHAESRMKAAELLIQLDRREPTGLAESVGSLEASLSSLTEEVHSLTERVIALEGTDRS